MDSRHAQGLLTIAFSSFLWSTFSLTQQLLSYASGRALTVATQRNAVLPPFIDLNGPTIFSCRTTCSLSLRLPHALLYLTFAEALHHRGFPHRRRGRTPCSPWQWPPWLLYLPTG